MIWVAGRHVPFAVTGRPPTLPALCAPRLPVAEAIRQLPIIELSQKLTVLISEEK
jgi:hypothetical protein